MWKRLILRSSLPQTLLIRQSLHLSGWTSWDDFLGGRVVEVANDDGVTRLSSAAQKWLWDGCYATSRSWGRGERVRQRRMDAINLLQRRMLEWKSLHFRARFSSAFICAQKSHWRDGGLKSTGSLHSSHFPNGEAWPTVTVSILHGLPVQQSHSSVHQRSDTIRQCGDEDNLFVSLSVFARNLRICESSTTLFRRVIKLTLRR